MNPKRIAVASLLLVSSIVILVSGLDAKERGQAAVTAAASQDEEKPSYFTELWQLTKKTREGKPGVTFHRSNYALAFSYNSSPNPAPLQEVNPDKTLTKPEVT
ncbi:MAG: hypothetical protein WCC00_04260, partial [Candidatus Aminicenantales bacterium]